MRKFLFPMFAILAFVACADIETPPPAAPEITLDAEVANFTTDSGSTTITFTSSDSWSAEVINSRAVGWCSVMPTCGNAGNAKITINTTANQTPDDRIASVVIKSGTTEKIITVFQKQKDALTVTSSRFEVPANGGEVEIEVKANIDFEYTIDESANEWIEYQATRAMKDSTLVFNVKKNDNDNKREAKITIKSGEFCEDVSIYQEGTNPSIILSQNEYTIPSAGETIVVAIKNGVDAEIEMPSGVDWITESTTRAESPYTYYFDIAPNEEYEARSAEIKFINTKNKQSEIVAINQVKKNAIVVADDSYTIDCDGGEIEIELSHNVEFDISISDDWITQKQTRGLETSKLTFVVAKNDAFKSRDGEITFTAKDKTVTQTVAVTQQEKTSKLYVEVTCDEATLRSHINQAFDSEATKVQPEGDGYVISLPPGCRAIPSRAFYFIHWLTQIIIDSTITSIGTAAFNVCSNLTSVTIPDSVTLMGEYVFAECNRLTSVTIPNNIKVIERHAFEGCRKLTSVTIPNGVTSIGEYAFARCEELISVTIPNGVTSIGENAFGGCISLQSLTIPDSVASIGMGMCAGCSSLESIYGKFASEDNRCLIISGELVGFAPAGLTTYSIPDSVTSIGEYAFKGCNNLLSINITAGVTEIVAHAFFGCDSLTSLTIPDSVTEIGVQAFYGCSSLESFYGKFASEDNRCLIISGELVGFAPAGLTEYTFPDSITSIRELVFSNCLSLRSVTIPDSFKKISDAAFMNCRNLQSVNISDSVTEIGAQAFQGCYGLHSINIPDSVTKIGHNAFKTCHALDSINIPNGVTEIAMAVFNQCYNLRSVNIPDGVTKIGNSAFSSCQSLTNITIPDSVTEIWDAAFMGCQKLTSVYCKRTTPPTGHPKMFSGCPVKIYVPAWSVDAYKAADGWKDYADSIEPYDF